MRQVTLMLTLLCAVAVAAAEEPKEGPKGTLCFVSNGKLMSCGKSLHVDPAPTRRLFVWTADDGSRIAAGALAPNGDSVALDGKEWQAVKLRVIAPGDVSLELSNGRDKWPVSLPAKMVNRVTGLLLMPGHAVLTAKSEHHFDIRRNIDASDLGELRFRPLPVVTGRVVVKGEKEDVPLSGAAVATGKGEPLGLTDGLGVFRAELAPPFPVAIVVSHPGYASKTVTISRDVSDKDVGVVRLVAGQTLTVRFARPERKALAVTLYRQDANKYEPTKIETRSVGADDEEITFNDVAEAPHVLVVSGDKPLERMSVGVKPPTAEVKIEPYTLDGEVRFGGEPLGRANVEFGAVDQTWRIAQTTDAEGKFGGTAWHHGAVFAAVSGQDLGGWVHSNAEIGADPSSWTIDIPKRFVTGRVYDAGTKQPIQAEMNLRRNSKSSQQMSTIRPDSEGRFRVIAVEPGEYEIFAEAPGYMKAEVKVTIAEGDGSKHADLPLSRGTAQPLELQWPDGTPVAGARLCDTPIGNGMCLASYVTDRQGRATLRGGKGETRTLYVLPREGSLAVLHVPIGGDESKPAHATVAMPVGTIRIRFDGPRAAVAMRWNGELIPQEIVTARYMGSAFRGDELVWDRLPTGVYELWPEREPSRPPVRVGVATGEQTATIVTK
jgi:hypothetical protein